MTDSRVQAEQIVDRVLADCIACDALCETTRADLIQIIASALAAAAQQNEPEIINREGPSPLQALYDTPEFQEAWRPHAFEPGEQVCEICGEFFEEGPHDVPSLPPQEETGR